MLNPERRRSAISIRSSWVVNDIDAVAVLDLTDRWVVGGAVGLGAPDNPHIRRGRVDHRQALRQRTVVVRRCHDEVLGLGAGGALAGVGEHVGPHVEHRQHVVPVAGVGGVHDDRTGGEVQPRRGVQGVEVGSHDRPELRIRKRTHVVELVRRAVAGLGVGRGVDGLQTGDVHHHQRVQVQGRFPTQRRQITGQHAHGTLSTCLSNPDSPLIRPSLSRTAGAYLQVHVQLG